ncbi:hypothetical protein GGR88_000536 [Sphingomonas jejuensis]|uniref:Ice-binding protein C-terminal domain-containing protein n=1 Tax=Sphingomonas jejuensis TaxID=904715 RepID=A0ABX0XJV1_9SPHN|nr:PEPxxWA-CTERM sorting domain-containing protein [Sphingomonas jejuensis]NJC33062.1 hypothetical protein [Sphingomonas jejuensis]
MMIRAAFAATTLLAFATPVMAQTVTNGDIRTIAGGTTTTDATGTRTTNPGARQTAVQPGNMTWYQANLGGGATLGVTTDYARGGNGSVFFNTASGDSKADLQYNLGGLIELGSLQSVSFDWFRDPASDTGAAFAPVLRFEMFKDGSYAGSLVLENVYQNQTNAVEGSWQTLSATRSSGIFWATRDALGPTFANANGGQLTLDQWIARNSGSSLAVGAINIGVGSGWSGTFRGAVDNVQFAFGDGPAGDFNFEVAAAAVPEPATWAMMIAGFGMVGMAARRGRAVVAA